jgi:hypothetical protein
MKYLKGYKLFEDRTESDEEVKANFDDILLDLKDEGFDCHCNIGWGENGFSVELRIYKDSVDKVEQFEFWNGIEDAMNRIYSYVTSISDKVKLYYIFDGPDGEDEVFHTLEPDTLRRTFPEFYRKWEDGFIIYFEFFDKRVIHL